MKVILRKRIDKLGDMGDVINVAEGYARNYLFPYKLAFKSSPDAERQIETLKRRRMELEAQRIEEAKKVAEELAGKTVQLVRKADGEKLYGALHPRDIAKATTEQLKYEISHKMVVLESPIKEIGEYAVTLKLDHGVDAAITVIIKGEQVADEDEDGDEHADE